MAPNLFSPNTVGQIFYNTSNIFTSLKHSSVTIAWVVVYRIGESMDAIDETV